MKPYHLNWRKSAALLAMLTMVVVYSCRKGNEVNTAETKATAVSDARSWYEKTFPLKTSSGKYSTMDLGSAGPATQGDFSQLINPTGTTVRYTPD
jgi:hypothetical protein